MVSNMLKTLTLTLAIFAATAVIAAAADDKPKSPKAAVAYDQAMMAGMHGTYKEALEKFKKTAALEPDFAPAYNGMGLSLANLNRHKEAVASFEKAIKLRPGMAKAYYNCGVALTALKRYHEATKKFVKAAALQPRSAHVYNAWGLALVEMGKYDEAVQKFKRSAQLDPGSAAKINKQIKGIQKLKAAKGKRT